MLYEQALQQRDWEVAEHLLCALETIACRECSSLSTQQAYLGLADIALHCDAPTRTLECEVTVGRTPDPRHKELIMRSVYFPVIGMKCDRCAQTLQSVLSAQAGVQQVVVSLENARVEVFFDPSAVNENILASAIEGAGFEVPGGCP